MQPKQYELMYLNESNHWWFQSKKKFINIFIKKEHKNLNILDVGSGTGGTTNFLKYFGKVQAIEPSKYAQKYLKYNNLNYVAQTFEKFVTDSKFDLICFFDVLYHKKIEKDDKALIKAATLLNKGGKILITDCALPFLFSYHDIKVYAKKRYYLSEMESLVSKAGFKILKSSYVYFFVFPLFFLIRLLQKKINIESVTLFPKIINSLLLKICEFESHLLKFVKFPIGSSIIIYAEKI